MLRNSTINLNDEPIKINNIPFISIIVPTYNNAEFLKKCLNSIINQTLKNIEIIIVNDGSTDNTDEILSEYKNKDERIIVLKQNNLLQGCARNSGLKIAKGDYIGFVDSDDWIELEYYEKLYNAAIKYDSDIALATNIRIGNGKEKKRLKITKEENIKNFQEKIDISNQAKNPCPTNKIYKREMLIKNNIIFPQGVYCEDKIFTLKALYYANSITAVPDCYYYYYRNLNSTVKSKINKKKLKKDKNIACLEVLNFLKDKKDLIRDKQFFAITGYYPIESFSLIIKKESLKTAHYYLFGLIKILEKKL